MHLVNDNATLLRSTELARLNGGLGVRPRDDRPAVATRPGALRKVALVIETSSSFGRGLLQGIARYNREHGTWSTCFRSQDLNAPLPIWLRNWSGDGMLIRLATTAAFQWARRSNVPVVTLGSNLAMAPFANVSTDDRQVAKLGIDHLRERGFGSLAFCGRQAGECAEFDQRVEQFRRLAGEENLDCQTYEAVTDAEFDWDEQQERLSNWIRFLPKPVGIMACDDERGHEVLDACRRAGVCVPDEVAVIGVGNDLSICDLSIPSLTSIDTNAEGVGYEAAALLDRMMGGEKRPARPVQLAPRGVVTRRSTDLIASEDQEVGRALRFIRENACRGLQVAGVLSYMAMSRASLQQRVKQVAGRTIHQEIQRVRLARVKDLLAMSDITIKQVARESGFASVQYLTRVFRTVTGETPARYRLRRSK